MDLNRFYGNIKSRLLIAVKDYRLASLSVRIVSEKTENWSPEKKPGLELLLAIKVPELSSHIFRLIGC